MAQTPPSSSGMLDSVLVSERTIPTQKYGQWTGSQSTKVLFPPESSLRLLAMIRRSVCIAPLGLSRSLEWMHIMPRSHDEDRASKANYDIVHWASYTSCNKITSCLQLDILQDSVNIHKVGSDATHSRARSESRRRSERSRGGGTRNSELGNGDGTT